MFQPPFASPLEETVVIVGVGLIGGSLAAAVKRQKIARTVIGVGRDPGRIEAAREAGLIDQATTDISTVIERANLIVFCTPVDRLVKDVRAVDLIRGQRASQVEQREILMTDVGSVKSSICRELADIQNFIGSHPIAGSHRQGFEAADANLFQDKTCVLTPVASSESTQTLRLERLWQAVGMRTLQMSPEAHDSSIAMTSHLPHLIAAALASTLSNENRPLTGTGFRDTTRIAAGDPSLWTGILINNAQSVIAGIDQVQHRIAGFKQALEDLDVEAVRRLLMEGQRSRTALDGPTGAAN